MPAAAKSRQAKGAEKPADVPSSESAAVATARKPARRRTKPIADPNRFARRQVARLEEMVEELIQTAKDGEMTAIDRILKILDRLDRYHGFSAPPSSGTRLDNDARERILRKLSDIDARRAAQDSA